MTRSDMIPVKRVASDMQADSSDDGSLSESEIQPKNRVMGPKSKTYKYRKVSDITPAPATVTSDKQAEPSGSKGTFEKCE